MLRMIIRTPRRRTIRQADLRDEALDNDLCTDNNSDDADANGNGGAVALASDFAMNATRRTTATFTRCEFGEFEPAF